MPRGPRLDAPGALHHVIARGIERRHIFHRDRDRRDFLTRLAQLTVATGAGLYAWCLMPNHVHLLFRTGCRPLSSVMQSALGGYVTTFNRRYHRSGHLFQNRFKSILVEDEPYFLQLVRYIHLNPLRARLVTDLEELETYPWTGHAVLLGHRRYPPQDTSSVLLTFADELDTARRVYLRFVAEALTDVPPIDVSGGGLRRSAGGWTLHTPAKRGRERWGGDERILGSSAFVAQVLTTAPSPPAPAVTPSTSRSAMVAVLCQRVACAIGVPPSAITSRSCRPAAVTARALVSYLAVTRCGLSLAEVARALTISAPTVLRGCRAGPQLLAATSLDPERLLPQP